ncbi:dTMP kinase [Streptomyces sp. NPDC002659]|uniref:dTMP kinase n=1 Tax=Streptomyces sp. NPDC002659 TaxID=3364656 RepID=UPI0036984ECF
MEHEIKPSLKAGDTVICDRYVASTLVLQRLDGVSLKFLLDLNADILMPDLAVILTASPGPHRQPDSRARRPAPLPPRPHCARPRSRPLCRARPDPGPEA